MSKQYFIPEGTKVRPVITKTRKSTFFAKRTKRDITYTDRDLHQHVVYEADYGLPHQELYCFRFPQDQVDKYCGFFVDVNNVQIYE